ncbi:hypothetical protein T12_8553 [Trichinella patagoniensis]|uniref:Uncharacterized protein n=1 Tax=Trichinella patagoniensis TaxID=990121 RepID=A0A0V0YVQ8_9BILA|nr:hypothetical protein T12_8553 [Trichinella patagoniensis]
MATLEAIYSTLTGIYNKKVKFVSKAYFRKSQNSKGYSLAFLKSRKF